MYATEVDACSGSRRARGGGPCLLAPPQGGLTHHDSWAYFAVKYGLVVIGAVQPSDFFTELSALDVADLID